MKFLYRKHFIQKTLPCIGYFSFLFIQRWARVTQSQSPDFKHNSIRRFQISVTPVMLPERNWTIVIHSVTVHVEAVIRILLLCQNFCGSFPINLLRIHLRFLTFIFRFVFLLFIICLFQGCHCWFCFFGLSWVFFLRADMYAFVCLCCIHAKIFM